MANPLNDLTHYVTDVLQLEGGAELIKYSYRKFRLQSQLFRQYGIRAFPGFGYSRVYNNFLGAQYRSRQQFGDGAGNEKEKEEKSK